MDHDVERKKMVFDQLIKRGIKDHSVIDVMGRVPRHLFVEEALADRAYGDYPLPIGERQTISQPYIVALMTEALELKGVEKTLEIGTGSGYQTAILAELSDRVFTMERIKSLSLQAMHLLDSLGYTNIVYKVGDGTHGWKEEAPFDAMMVTAASPDLPQTLLSQMADGGRMVIPVGSQFSQTLVKVVRRGDDYQSDNLTGCMFVKLIGDFGWKD